MDEKKALRNTNRWSTKQLVTMAVLVAIGWLISWIELPLIPAAAFLKYDPSQVAMLFGTFVFGPAAGSVVGLLIALLHWSTDGIVGVGMNMAAMLAMGIPAGLIYTANRTRKGAAIGLLVGSVVQIVVLIVLNLIVDPIYYGMPYSAVVALVPTALLPFNAAKAAINSVLTFLVYKRVADAVRPAKKAAPKPAE